MEVSLLSLFLALDQSLATGTIHSLDQESHDMTSYFIACLSGRRALLAEWCQHHLYEMGAWFGECPA